MVGRHNWGWSIGRSWDNWSGGVCRCWGIGSWSSMVGRGWGMVSILVVLDQRLVRAGSTLILDISMVLLVLIHKVVHNLDPAVRQLHSVLTCSEST